LKAFDHLLELLDLFARQGDFRLELMDHPLFNRSNTHPPPIGFSCHPFVGDLDVPEIGTRAGQCSSVRFRLSLQTLYRGL